MRFGSKERWHSGTSRGHQGSNQRIMSLLIRYINLKVFKVELLLLQKPDSMDLVRRKETQTVGELLFTAAWSSVLPQAAPALLELWEPPPSIPPSLPAFSASLSLPFILSAQSSQCVFPEVSLSQTVQFHTVWAYKPL